VELESIGDILKARRAEKGLTLADVFDATKITMQNLAALEEDRFDAFANRVYARAFLRDYANFLGLDSNELLQRYEAEWVTPAVPPVVQKKKSPVAAVLVILLLLGVVFAGGYYYYQEYMHPVATVSKTPVAPTGEDESPVAPPKPAPPIETPKTTPQTEKPAGTPVVNLQGEADKPAATEPGKPAEPAKHVKPIEPVEKPDPAVPKDKVSVQLVVLNQPVWVRVKVDGSDMFTPRVLQPGEKITIAPSKNVWVRAGNGGALDVVVDGKNIGRFGKAGQPLTRVFKPTP